MSGAKLGVEASVTTSYSLFLHILHNFSTCNLSNKMSTKHKVNKQQQSRRDREENRKLTNIVAVANLLHMVLLYYVLVRSYCRPIHVE